MILGIHNIVELYDCDEEILKSSKQIKEIFLEAAEAGKATIVESWFHNFSPYGVTGVLVIAESHMSIHTWHEHKYCAIDIFSCSEKLNNQEIVDHLTEKLKSKKRVVKNIKRGIIND